MLAGAIFGAPPAQPRRILLITGGEGVAGICRQDQTEASNPELRALLTGEVNAAVEGFLEGGADEVDGTATLEIEYTTRGSLNPELGGVPWVRILDDRTIRYTGKDVLDVWKTYRLFVNDIQTEGVQDRPHSTRQPLKRGRAVRFKPVPVLHRAASFLNQLSWLVYLT